MFIVFNSVNHIRNVILEVKDKGNCSDPSLWER